MARWTTKLDTSGLDKKMTRITNKLNKAGTETTTDLGERGKWYAKTIAPKYTGKTADFIIARHGKKQSTVIARNPTAGRSDGFALVRWMHESPRAQSHIRTGEPTFMFIMRDYLNEIKQNVAKGNFNKINIR